MNKHVTNIKIAVIYFVAIFLFHNTIDAQMGYHWAIDESRQTLDELLTEYPGVSVSVAVKGEIIWEEGFGFANAEKNEKVTESHRFLYYSLSKSILGAAIYQLQKEGKIDIENSIKTYLNDLPSHYEKVKIKHLLGHTSGIRHYNKGEWNKISMDRCEKTDAAVEVFVNDPLESEPGSTYEYSSFGYVLLSHLLEKVGGKSFDQYFQDVFFDPMNISGIERPLEPSLADMQAVRYEKWNPKKSDGKETQINNSCKFGGGGFIGTASGLALFHSKILSREMKASNSSLYSNLNEADQTSYGYGLGINTKTDNTYYAHTGSGRGGSAVLIIYPKYELVIVLLGNIKSDGLVSNIGQIGNNFKKAISN